MKKLTKSLVTALSLATATLSVIPQAAVPAQAATKAKSKTGTEYKDGSYTIMVTVKNLGNNIDVPNNFFPAATVTIKNHKISSVAISVDDIDDAGLYYVQVNDEVAIGDQKTLTFDGSVYKNGLQNASINISGDPSYCNITFGDLPSSAYETVTETSATVVKRTAAVYDRNGKKILTFGRTTIKNKKYYQTGYNSFISASNVDGTTRTLKKNTYVYKKSKGKAVRYKNSVLKQNSQQQTYGSAVSIKGKKYYIIGVGKYVAKSDFK